MCDTLPILMKVTSISGESVHVIMPHCKYIRMKADVAKYKQNYTVQSAAKGAQVEVWFFFGVRYGF